HGEPERNDMVQYFAEQLAGFFATQNGWVQLINALAVVTANRSATTWCSTSPSNWRVSSLPRTAGCS
ncbi:hypothetical protein GR254_25155, partial [Mycobacterium tuberculosis]|nr:hypothetical protein [Mycobacterium tuberculosis]